MKISSWLDAYEVKARLFPILLAVAAPIAVALIGLGVEASKASTAVAALASIGTFFLATMLARTLGRAAEHRNYREWNGAPTTQLLRHSDAGIKPETKDRYHRILSAGLGRDLPTSVEESRDPVAADCLYESAVLWLRSKTVNTEEFRILHNENIAYGFVRNGQGLRPLALAYILAGLVWVVTSNGVITLHALIALPRQSMAQVAICTAFLVIWTFFFRSADTKRAGFIYAHALLRACDAIPAPTAISTNKIIVPPSWDR